MAAKSKLLDKRDSSRTNMVFQFAYQVIIIVIPLIVSPYLTRTLGSDALGIYSYTNSIAYYFLRFGMLGIITHGQRILSQRRDDEEKFRTTFWSLFFVHIFFSFLFFLLYLGYGLFLCNENQTIVLIQGIYVLSGIFDITWLFYGIEKFRSLVVRNTIIKIIETALIFILIKDPDDLWIYTFIMCSSTCLAQLVMIPMAFRAVRFTRFKWTDVKEHFKPMFILFIGNLAVSLYTVFDTTILGIFTDNSSVAYYEYAYKIIKIPITFISVIGTVLYPRMCSILGNNDMKAAGKYMNYSFSYILFIAMGTIFGIFAVGEQFAVVYYGEEFAESGTIMCALSLVVLLSGTGSIFRQQYLYPMKKDTLMVIITSINAVINLVLSLILVQYMGLYGVIVGTLCAELFGFVAEMIITRRIIDFKYFIREFVVFLCLGLLMFLLIELVKYFIGTAGIVSLIIQVAVGLVFFVICTGVYFLFFNKTMRNQIINWPVLRKIFHTRFFRKILKLDNEAATAAVVLSGDGTTDEDEDSDTSPKINIGVEIGLSVSVENDEGTNTSDKNPNMEGVPPGEGGLDGADEPPNATNTYNGETNSDEDKGG